MFRAAILVICLVLPAFGAGAEPDIQIPVLSDPEADTRVADLLAEAADRESLDRLLQKPALRCFDVGPSGELCEWQLARSDPGWRALADAAGTRDRVSVLCVLPSNGAARDPYSCTAHVRRSNRDRWKVQRRPGSKMRSVAIRKTRENNLLLATAMLSEASTLTELSRLLGESPGECTTSETERVCLWRTTSHTWGHGTLAIVAGVDNTKRVRLECVLPLGQARRTADSCSAREDE